MDHEIDEVFVEDGKESPLRKIFIIIIAVFMIVLFVSYIGISYGTGDIIGGLVESSLIEDKVIGLNDGRRIVLGENVLIGLNEIYENNKEVEFKTCLTGAVIDGDYYIDKIVYPKMFSQKYNQVIAEPCPADTLIDLHSHPEKHCIASQQDMKNFEELKKKNPAALMLIMCEEDRVNVYG